MAFRGMQLGAYDSSLFLCKQVLMQSKLHLLLAVHGTKGGRCDVPGNPVQDDSPC